MSGKKITNTWLEPQPKGYTKAIEVLQSADKIIL
jgi:acetyl-CoA carboxylase alpha subunit